MKFTLLFIASLAVTVFATCPTQPPPPTKPPLPAEQIGSLYHPCPRSMNNWLLQAYKVVLKCVGGPSNNKCKGSSCGAGLVCCQDTNGCNQCVGK